MDILTKIDEMIEASTEKLAADTIRLVNINSEKSEPAPGAPWVSALAQCWTRF